LSPGRSTYRVGVEQRRPITSTSVGAGSNMPRVSQQPSVAHAIDRRTGLRMCPFAETLTDAPGDDSWQAWQGQRCPRCQQAVDVALLRSRRSTDPSP
jgi:hypothetical protein